MAMALGTLIVQCFNFNVARVQIFTAVANIWVSSVGFTARFPQTIKIHQKSFRELLG